MPTIYFQREAVKAGGLMSYGASIPDMYRQVGVYTGLIQGCWFGRPTVLLPTTW